MKFRATQPGVYLGGIFKSRRRKGSIISGCKMRHHVAIALLLVLNGWLYLYYLTSFEFDNILFKRKSQALDTAIVLTNRAVTTHAHRVPSTVAKRNDVHAPEATVQTHAEFKDLGPQDVDVIPDRQWNKPGICYFPEMDLWDKSKVNPLPKSSSLDCSSGVPNVVRLRDEAIIVDRHRVKLALDKFMDSGDLGFCEYKLLQRNTESDFSAVVLAESDKFKKSVYLDGNEREFKVQCFDTESDLISRSYFALMRPDPETERVLSDSYKVHTEKHSPAETLSILMLGIDGLSKQHFARAMPKTREFLIKELGALEMNKHSRVGGSAFFNVLPLLTGRTSEELGNDTYWRFQPGGLMDPINEAFVWSDARRLGYRTSLMFDAMATTGFHQLNTGFQRSPVDHYMRSMVVDSLNDALMRDNPHCFGDQPEVSKLYDYWLQLLHHYNSTKSNQTPFFAYSFFSRLTHNNHSMAYAADALYLKVLQALKATYALNNTVIIWFSDRGQRYGPGRHTTTVPVEENSPLLFFAFPPWFEKKYPKVMRVFRTNQNRLTSFYDIYATLQDILFFEGVVRIKGKLGERSISLFRKIPLYRSCKDAHIPEEHCLCSPLAASNLPHKLRLLLGTSLTSEILSLLEDEENCAKLSLKSVKEVLAEKEQESKHRPGTRLFRVSIVTVPGRAEFDARMRLNLKTNEVQMVGEIERTNHLKGQAACMSDEHLRKFCYCKELVKEKTKRK